jgi:hypothetical protein
VSSVAARRPVGDGGHRCWATSQRDARCWWSMAVVTVFGSPRSSCRCVLAAFPMAAGATVGRSVGLLAPLPFSGAPYRHAVLGSAPELGGGSGGLIGGIVAWWRPAPSEEVFLADLM